MSLASKLKEALLGLKAGLRHAALPGARAAGPGELSRTAHF